MNITLKSSRIKDYQFDNKQLKSSLQRKETAGIDIDGSLAPSGYSTLYDKSQYVDFIKFDKKLVLDSNYNELPNHPSMPKSKEATPLESAIEGVLQKYNIPSNSELVADLIAVKIGKVTDFPVSGKYEWNKVSEKVSINDKSLYKDRKDKKQNALDFLLSEYADEIQSGILFKKHISGYDPTLYTMLFRVLRGTGKTIDDYLKPIRRATDTTNFGVEISDSKLASAQSYINYHYNVLSERAKK